MTDQTDARAKLAAIIAGLEGVTPGPWSIAADTFPTGDDPDYDERFLMAPDESGDHSIASFRHGCEEASEHGARDANASHVARCDPDTMRALAALVASQDAEISRLREALEWYASDEAWTIKQVEGSDGDYGRRARAALAGESR